MVYKIKIDKNPRIDKTLLLTRKADSPEKKKQETLRVFIKSSVSNSRQHFTHSNELF